jgi:hypothetical protein
VTRREALAALLAAPLLQVRSLRAQTNDLTALTIAEAGRRLASRSITPVQLANAYLSRISQLNKDLNAFITVTVDLARREAKALDDDPKGPMWGIPIAHKDLFETKGVRTTAGSMIYDDYVPDENAAIVQQLERAGAVMLGKTNTHELGGGVTTINPFYGTTKNPVDRARIAGGSSGGSAAAVVSHLCAAATGSDTGGSVRIPAALCGCVGFKPTFGKISTQGCSARADLRSRRLPDAHGRGRADLFAHWHGRRHSALPGAHRRRPASISSTTSIRPSRARHRSRSIPTSTSPSTQRRWSACSIRL